MRRAVAPRRLELELDLADAEQQTRAQLADVGSSVLLCADADQFNRRCGRRNRLAILTQAFQVKLDRLSDQPHDLSARFVDRDAAWQVRYVGAERVFTLLNNDDVIHRLLLDQSTTVVSKDLFNDPPWP
jgi:hypothetical protein